MRVGFAAALGAWVALLTVTSDARAAEASAASPAAAGRPRVGLALSGGGARGFAHVGVLQVLEEIGVPVDVIAGTSMGSVIGGLRAIGNSPAELVTIATTLDWQELFAGAAPRSALFFERKKEASRFLLDVAIRGWRPVVPTGITSGEKLSNLLSLLTLSVATVRDFDQLPVPFRAIATDIVTGAQVVLDGSQLPLAESIRASIAIPLVFTPVELGERLLVDGGLVNNLPVDVVRAMGADVVIAVDVSTPLRTKEELESLVAIMDQAVSLQIARETERQLAGADLVITPEFGALSAGDFAQAAELIERGRQAALAEVGRLRAIAAAASRVRDDRAPSPPAVAARPLRIDAVRVEGEVGRREVHLARSLDIQPGEALTAAELEGRVGRVYGLGFFESVAFAVAQDDRGRNVLTIRVREREPVLARFGARYDDKVGGVGLAGVSLSGIGAREGVLSGEIQFGGVLGGELAYFRHGIGGVGAFVRPRAFYRDDFRFLYEDARRVARFTDRSGGFELGVGNTFRNFGEVTAGYRWRRELFTAQRRRGEFPDVRESVGSVWLGSRLDTLDRVPYPRAGNTLDLAYELASTTLGGSASFSRVAAAYQRFWSPWDRHTLELGLRAGSALETDLPPYEDFLLGGPGALLGYQREELRGRNMVLGSVGYRYRLTELPLGLGRGIYATARFTSGDVWRSLEDAFDEIGPRYGGGVGLGADTIVGPVDLDVGIGSGGRERVYLSAGFPF